MDDQHDPHHGTPPDAADLEPDPPESKPLNLKDSFGTALGSAMLGLEQALRDGPPAQVQAAEHVPERGGSGQDGDVVIEFPDPLKRGDPADGERDV